VGHGDAVTLSQVVGSTRDQHATSDPCETPPPTTPEPRHGSARVPRVDHDDVAAVRFYAAGVYGRLRDRELDRISQPDPRWFLQDAGADELEHAPRCKPILNVAALTAGEPVVVPRWMLGGHDIPEVRDWPVFADRMVREFVVSADDVIRPA
jgi:hypothetical protein